MSDKHIVNSIEWILNQGCMGLDVPITDNISEIEKTTIDWPVNQNPNPRLIASSILAAAQYKISPSKPHSFTVHKSSVGQGRVGVTTLCWYEGVDK
jgi:hypothetical protein